MDEAEVALLDQVEQRQTRGLVPLGDGHHEAEIAVGEGLRGHFAGPYGPAKLTHPRRAVLPVCGKFGAGVTSGRGHLGQTDLVLSRQEGVTADLSEVQTEQILFGHLQASAWQWVPFLVPGN